MPVPVGNWPSPAARMASRAPSQKGAGTRRAPAGAAWRALILIPFAFAMGGNEMNSFNALHKPSLFILMLALLAGNLFPAGAGNVTCGTPLNVTGALYTMNNSSSISGATCFNVSAANVTIDCKGFSVAGNNSTGTYGFYTSQVNTTVRNCNVSNFFYGIYFYGATDGLIQNVTASGSYTTGYVVYVSSGATASLGSHRTMINGLVSASLSNTYARSEETRLNSSH